MLLLESNNLDKRARARGNLLCANTTVHDMLTHVLNANLVPRVSLLFLPVVGIFQRPREEEKRDPGNEVA